ncbi:MAG: PKD domain-containing protein [Thermoplasmata archaeon]|nr:PKD domain-containing protein [Thermoplasmata archaeon]
MNTTFRRQVASRAGPILLAMVLLLSFPNVGASPHSLVTAPAPAPHRAPGLAVHASPGVVSGHAPAKAARIHPLTVNCPMLYPTWAPIGNYMPISPSQLSQSPCPWIGQDEQHVTFSSQQAGSGSHLKVPLYLPKDPNSNQTSSYLGFYVGIVVTGDVHSEWHQSYAMLEFAPSGAGASLSYNEGISVYSMVNESYWGSAGCPTVSLNFTWNQSYFCEVDEFGQGMGTVSGSIPSGSWLNITFDGVVGGTNGLKIYANDSTSAGHDFFTTLNTTNGGTEPDGNHTFEPTYSASCRDACYLKWGMGYGLGVGFTPCPTGPAAFAACDSYNQYTWLTNPPVEIGIPEYYTAGAFTGDYRWLAPESASGECNTAATPGQVTSCFDQQGGGGSGYYPIFTFNGTQLNFGTNWSWTTEDFGARTGGEFRSDGFAQDLTPMFLDQVSNDSLASFIRAGAALNVSVRLQDVGSIVTSTLHYQIGNGPTNDLAMTRIAGSASIGIYNVTIPVGPNGLITFSITGANAASAQINSTMFHVKRGPLPTFVIHLSTNPAGCGRVFFNGSAYVTGQTVSITPGFYEIQGAPCYPSVFFGWNVTTGVALTGQPSRGTQYAQAAISSNASIQGVWKYVRPLDRVLVLTNPGVCGSVALNGTLVSNNTAVMLLDQGNYSLQVGSACAMRSFGGWTVTSHIVVLGNVLEPTGNGTITANFVLSSSSDQVIFYTAPTDCGGVIFQGAGYTDSMALAIVPGTYQIAPAPCAHFGFRNFSVSSGLGLSGWNLTVGGVGWVRETNEHLTEIHAVTNPTSCGSVSVDGLNFTNGQVDSVSNNSTHSVYATPCAGYSLFALSADGGLSLFGNVLVANGSGHLLAVFQVGSARSFVAFQTTPSNCGTILFEGTHYRNSQYTNVAPGTVATVSTTACANYGFVRWSTSGDIVIVGSNAYINGTSGGAIMATFTPLVSVFLYTSPAQCGTITLAGVTYFGNESVELAESAFYPLSAQPCGNYTLGGWVNSSSAQIQGSQVYLSSAAVLTAVFVPVHYSVTVLLTPPTCGQVQIGTTHVSNGTVLSLGIGSYNISTSACLGFHLNAWNAVGGVNVSGTVLRVNGSGTLTGNFGPIPPVVSISASPQVFVGNAVSVTATVQVLIPPYNYTYSWSFGDGSIAKTPANFTTHIYQSAGTFTVSVSVSDPYHRLANASQTVVVLPTNGGVLGGSLPPVVFVGIGILVVVAAILLLGSLYRRPPPTSDEESTSGPAAPALPEGDDNSPPPDPQP